VLTILALLVVPKVHPTLWFPYELGNKHDASMARHAKPIAPPHPDRGLLAGGYTDPKSGGYFGPFHNAGKKGCRLVAQLPNGYYACLTIAPGSAYTHTAYNPPNNGFTDEFVLTSGSIEVQEEDQLPASCPGVPVGYPNPISGVTPRLRLRRSNGRTTLAGTGTDYTLASPGYGSTTSWTASVALGGSELFYNDMDTGGFAYLNSDDGRMCVGPDQGNNPPAMMMCSQDGG